MSAEERQGIIEVTPVGRQETRQLSKEILCDIMQPRAVELLQHIAHEVFGVRGQISSGVVLTGGGSLNRGMVEIAEQVFDAPTRLGFLEQKHFGGLLDEVQSPDWATACGLALASMRTQIREQNQGGKSPSRKVAEWFENFREKFR
jgi:cell division protein FtsA